MSVTSATGKCPHPDVGVAVQPFTTDSGEMMLMIQGMRCNLCGQKFRFKGITMSGDASPDEPTMRPDGLAVALPAVAA